MYVLNTKTKVHFIEHPEMQMARGVLDDCVRVKTLDGVKRMLADLAKDEKEKRGEKDDEPAVTEPVIVKDWTKLSKTDLIQYATNEYDITLDPELTHRNLKAQLTAVLQARESGEDEAAAMKAAIFTLPTA